MSDKRHILVVDDDRDWGRIMAKFLSGKGFAAKTAANGKEALEQILHDTPALVVLDLFMPELDGCSLLEVMRSYLRLQAIPVIIVTGLTDSPMIDRARTLKVNAILKKGEATPEEIAETVRTELHKLPT